MLAITVILFNALSSSLCINQQPGPLSSRIWESRTINHSHLPLFWIFQKPMNPEEQMRHQSLRMSHGPWFIVFHAWCRAHASAFRCYDQLRFQQFRALECIPPCCSAHAQSSRGFSFIWNPEFSFCLLFKLAYLFYSAKKSKFTRLTFFLSPCI